MSEDFFASSKALKCLRTLSLIEGCSLLFLLFVAMPLKYMADMSIAVRIVGMTHGLLFMGLVVFIFLVGTARNWTKGFIFMAFISASLPFGMLVLDRKLKAIS